MGYRACYSFLGVTCGYGFQEYDRTQGVYVFAGKCRKYSPASTAVPAISKQLAMIVATSGRRILHAGVLDVLYSTSYSASGRFYLREEATWSQDPPHLSITRKSSRPSCYLVPDRWTCGWTPSQISPSTDSKLTSLPNSGLRRRKLTRTRVRKQVSVVQIAGSLAIWIPRKDTYPFGYRTPISRLCMLSGHQDSGDPVGPLIC